MSKIIVSGVGNGMGCNASRLLKSSGHEVAIISRGETGRNVAREIGAHYSSCDLMDGTFSRARWVVRRLFRPEISLNSPEYELETTTKSIASPYLSTIGSADSEDIAKISSSLLPNLAKFAATIETMKKEVFWC